MRTVLRACVLALAFMPAAAADQCPPLRLAASVQLVPSAKGDAEYVPVVVGGARKLFLLDTGASATLISPTIVKELEIGTFRANVRLFDVTGNSTDRGAVTSLAIGNLRNDRVKFMVPSVDLESVFGKDVAGVLGADILGNLDVSVDFGAQKLDLLDPEHCEGKVVYWPERPLAVVPFKRVGMAQIIIPVTLDGRRIEAFVDTGASRSTIRQPRAERTFDLVMGSADAPASGYVNGDKDVPMWRHTFKSLALEGIDVLNPEIDIIPDRVSEHLAKGAETGTRINTRDEEIAPDILLGMNVLRHLHVYIAYKENRLYITPAGAPAPDQPPKAP